MGEAAKGKNSSTDNVNLYNDINIYLWEFPDGLAVKDLALLLLWHGFDPWSENFLMPWVLPKKKKKKKEKSVYTYIYLSM